MSAAAALALVRLLLQVAGAVAAGLRDRQLLDAGAARAVIEGVRDANSAIRRAARARAAVRHDASSVRTDPDNRDGDDY